MGASIGQTLPWRASSLRSRSEVKGNGQKQQKMDLYVEPKALVGTLSELPQIGHTRTCDCPPNHISCVTAKDWLKSQVAVWEFYYEGRDIRDKKIHPAVYPISLPARCIGLFTHR